MAIPLTYHIRVRGRLGAGWRGWFSGMELAIEPNGDTIIGGSVRDQAELHGVLTRIRDLGLTLVSACSLPECASAPRSAVLTGANATCSRCTAPDACGH